MANYGLDCRELLNLYCYEFNEINLLKLQSQCYFVWCFLYIFPSVLTHWGQDKVATMLQTFPNIFHWTKTFEFKKKLHWNLSLGSNWQWVSIGSDNGLVPNRQQAIIWTNDGPVYWYVYESLGLDELTLSALPKISCRNKFSTMPANALVHGVTRPWYRLYKMGRANLKIKKKKNSGSWNVVRCKCIYVSKKKIQHVNG